MRVIRGNSNLHTMLLMYAACRKAPEVEIRGSKVRNVRNMAVCLEARDPVITSFKARKMNLDYAKREWLWYLTADRMDDSICQHATMWQKLKQEDGSFFSNYGQYMFQQGLAGPDRPSQFEYVIKQLKADPYSRRASMVLLQPYHLFEENTDTVCTYAINFCIEAGHLHMTVHMRSNDVIFGFTNDAFCFWNLYEFVYRVLKHSMPDLEYGDYTHIVDSMHVYERHYEMIASIVADDAGGYSNTPIPRPSAQEVIQLINSRGQHGNGAYSNWLGVSGSGLATNASTSISTSTNPSDIQTKS